jgi:hypothetical protein
MKIEKYEKDGMVAVLYSPGYGAGWYSRNECEALLFDKELAIAVENKDKEAVLKRAEQLSPGSYFGGADDLKIYWVNKGDEFRITEYDGSESVEIRAHSSFIIA